MSLLWLGTHQAILAPLVGFSFSPHAASDQDPAVALRTLLDRLQPDVVRLPIYWSDEQPEPDRLDFSVVDRLVAATAAHNESATQHRASLILVVGIRNLGYPEVWVPAWVSAAQRADLSLLAETPAYRAYLGAAVARYAASHLLLAWQIENEPFDNVTAGHPGPVSLSVEAVDDQIRQLRRLDGLHPVVLTTYNSATVELDRRALSPWSGVYTLLRAPQPVGHPRLALGAADVLGLDAYVVTPTTPLDEASPRRRIDWKTGALTYWSQEADRLGKQMWIMEMQAGPWAGINGFTPSEFVYSARLYRQIGVPVVLFWGIEAWLQDPHWMSAGRSAVHVLRSKQAA